MIAILSSAIYAAISWLSWQFEFDSERVNRPIVAVLILFSFVFSGYLVAIYFASRVQQTRRLVWLIVGFALLFRVTMLFSIPIQEVDIYRYIWDGEVSAQGASPFQFPPAQILSSTNADTENKELNKLIALKLGNKNVAEVLRRVHYSELPTIYPPASQAVFYVVAKTTPVTASVNARVVIMKSWLTLFDLGVLLLVIKLLSSCNLPIGLSVIYGWCPLVMKEVANSGHLDTIAIFLMTLAVYLFVRIVDASDYRCFRFKNLINSLIVVLVLAAAVAAKLFPVVLAPLVIAGIAKRLGIRTTLLPAVVFCIATALLLWPILPAPFNSANSEVSNVTTVIPTPLSVSDVPSPGSTQTDVALHQSTVADPSLGVTTFLKSWEMNDFVFMLVFENLKLDSSEQTVWFSVVPDGIRHRIVGSTAQSLSIPAAEAPFMITRAVTTIVFGMIALWLVWRFWRNGQTAIEFCEAAFLTLAWFWLLLPTQNPWYWMWALPFLPFVRNRAWLAVSGIVLIYYLRFWLDYHFADTRVMGSPYKGAAFFDYVVSWLEFAPWFVWLAVECIFRTRTRLAKSS